MFSVAVDQVEVRMSYCHLTVHEIISVTEISQEKSVGRSEPRSLPGSPTSCFIGGTVVAKKAISF